jgi:hypothetical protein
MNVSAIDPTASALAQSAASPNAPARKATPPVAAPQAPALQAAAPAPPTPAAKVTISGVPATVKPEDRTLYLQILKSVGGNVNAALAALAAAEAKEASS